MRARTAPTPGRDVHGRDPSSTGAGWMWSQRVAQGHVFGLHGMNAVRIGARGLNMADLHGWQADPFGVHEQRYFSQGEPTKLVRDQGRESYHPLPGDLPRGEPPLNPYAPQATGAPPSDALVAVAFQAETVAIQPPPPQPAPGEGWWLASDGNWYPPQPPTVEAPAAVVEPTPPPQPAPGEGWWLAPVGNSHTPEMAEQLGSPRVEPPSQPEPPSGEGWWHSSSEPASELEALHQPTAMERPHSVEPWPRPGWWLASDGNWYPPQSPQAVEARAVIEPTPSPQTVRAEGWWLDSGATSDEAEATEQVASAIAAGPISPVPQGSSLNEGGPSPHSAVEAQPPPGEGWWLASDGNWYPPQPQAVEPSPVEQRAYATEPALTGGWWLASDGNWYPPESPPGDGWWLSSDGNWYPPEMAPVAGPSGSPGTGSNA
jgi:hypothetical protein